MGTSKNPMNKGFQPPVSYEICNIAINKIGF